MGLAIISTHGQPRKLPALRSESSELVCESRGVQTAGGNSRWRLASEVLAGASWAGRADLPAGHTERGPWSQRGSCRDEGSQNSSSYHLSVWANVLPPWLAFSGFWGSPSRWKWCCLGSREAGLGRYRGQCFPKASSPWIVFLSKALAQPCCSPPRWPISDFIAHFPHGNIYFFFFYLCSEIERKP